MEVWFGDESNPRPASDAVPDQLVEAGAPLRLRVVLAPDEELAAISLSLWGRTSDSELASFGDPELATDTGGGFTNVSWVTADWGSSRSLTSVSVESPNPVAGHTLQLKIARGGSGWYSPPGPHSVALTANTPINVKFPDTVADRVMLELMVTGVPTPCTLTAPTLSFGHVARDPGISLVGATSLFEHPGVLATGASVSVPELLESLRERLPAPLRDQSFTLEVDAVAAGLLGVSWDLTVDRLLEHFDGVGGSEGESTRALGWSVPVELALLTQAAVHAIEVQASWTPSSERVELSPDPDPELDAPDLSAGPDSARAGVAALLNPRYELAQGFRFTPQRPLVGVDLWVQAPRTGEALELSLSLVADQGGRPATDTSPLATVSVSLGPTDHSLGPRPSWLPIDLPEPVEIEAEQWWIVVRVEAGELAWIWTRPDSGGTRREDVSAPRYRRDGGAWLEREVEDPQAWALTRLRSHEPAPAPMPTLELMVDGTAHALTPSEADPGLLQLHPDAPLAGAQVLLRASSGVAGELALSQLSVRWRPAPAAGAGVGAGVQDLEPAPAGALIAK